MQYSVVFPGGTVKYLFDITFSSLSELVPSENCVILTDNIVAELYGGLFASYRTIVIPAGEGEKNWQIIENIAEELYQFEAHRKTFLVGVGGGVVTDITGFVASIYMRGIPFGFVPTTVLAMADASIGGKNGINFGRQKNFLGTVNQPEFILYDLHFLDTLPDTEWSNGFAEVIKYACLFDKNLFGELQENDIGHYRNNKAALQEVILQCTDWKNKVVLQDEKETGERKLLNFGHTAGHAFETLYQLPHGYAVALGMIAACIVSETNAGLDKEVKYDLAKLLQQYGLPVKLSFNTEQVMNVLKMDKKRNGDELDYIVLDHIGNGKIMTLPFDAIEQALLSFSHVSDY